jgi:hypothetical protein
MVTFHGAVAQMIFPVVAALRAVAKALWRVGDCEARVVHFPKEFGVSQNRRYTERRGNRFGQQALQNQLGDELARENPHSSASLVHHGRGGVSSLRLTGRRSR